jgi:hypothetical protein
MTKLQSIQAAHDATHVTTVVRHFENFKRFQRAETARETSPNGDDIEKFYRDAQRGKYGPITGAKFKEAEEALLRSLNP